MAEKQLIIAVEGTAAMGPYWSTVVTEYLEKIIRCFCANELNGQKTSNSTVELALVTFNTHGSYCGCLVQRSGWTRDVDNFLQWLSAVPFSGGGFNDVAIAEGLSEALMMFSIAQNGNQGQQNVYCQRHCILIAASNPYPLSTPVFRPPVQNLEQSENIDVHTENRLSDAETIAKSFAQCMVSLSVISPKQLPKLRAIYNAGKCNPQASDPPVDVKNLFFLVLLSENFLEARAALSRSGVPSLASNHSTVKVDMAPVTSVTGPPTSIPSVNGSMMNQQPISAANMPPATVKVEPSTVSSLVPGPTFSQIPSVGARTASQGVPLQASSPSPASQDMITNNDNLPDLKPVVSNISQPLRPVGPAPANVNILNNLSQARQAMQHSAALPMGQNSIGMHMSNMISSGMASSTPAQNILPSGQPAIPPIAGSGTLTQVTQTPAHAPFTAASSNMSGNSSIGVSQPMNNLQGGVSMAQSVPVMSQGNLAGTQMVQSGMAMNQNIMSGLGGPLASSGTGTMIPTPGMSQPAQSVVQPLGVNNNSAATIPMSQPGSNAQQQAPSKYVKVWEGNLSGQRQGQPVFITRLEGYRNATASETLAANWPLTMQIVRLISQDHMNNKQYVGKADFLVFRAINQHGFLGQLQEKKLCAVIQLPSQTLLLSVSDKACRLIGMLFPGDMVVFKPQVPNPQQQHHPQLQQQIPQLQQQQPPQQLPQLQQQQPQLSQLQQQPQLSQLQQLQPMPQQQQLPQLQQLQQIPPQQQMVGPGMGQAYVQGPGRSQLVSQGQATSQVPPSMPGGGFMG